jgi:hypothetical protein
MGADTDRVGGLRCGLQVHARGSDVARLKGVNSQIGVELEVRQAVASPFRAGDRLDVQRPELGRVAVRQVGMQADAQQNVVSEPAGQVNRLTASRLAAVEVAGEAAGDTQRSERPDDEAVVASPARDFDCLSGQAQARAQVEKRKARLRKR